MRYIYLRVGHKINTDLKKWNADFTCRGVGVVYVYNDGYGVSYTLQNLWIVNRKYHDLF